MLTTRRQQHLLDILSRDRQIIATDVAQSLGVSEDTIRRDLRDLARSGLLKRVHGGALSVAPAEANFAGRQSLRTAGKAAIGKLAAGMIQPKQIVILDGGTTTEQIARQLAPELEITIVTHSPSIALALSGHARAEVILIGGRLFKHSIVSMGAAADEAIQRIRADVFFMGVTGVHSEAGLTTGDFEEAAIKRSLSHRAAETYVLASAEKIGVASPYLILPLEEVTGILTEACVSDAALAPLARQGLTITRA